jgi:hypothetical protein
LSISDLAIDPQNPSAIYAVRDYPDAAGGVFRTTDGGKTWDQVFLNDYETTALTVGPQNQVTMCTATTTLPEHGASTSNVYCNPVGGQGLGLGAFGLTGSRISVLAIDPLNSSRVYAGTLGDGIFLYSGTNCSYSISPARAAYSSSGTRSDQIDVTTGAECGWMAVGNNHWVTVTSGTRGWGSGNIRFSVSPNPSPGPRDGTLAIADQTFAITQDGLHSAFSVGGVTPNSGPVSGGTSITITGSGFEVGASVNIGGYPAQITALTSDRISLTTSPSRAAGIGDVVVTNPGGKSVVLTKGFTYLPANGPQTIQVFVPIVLSSGGMNQSFYTSELTLTNRGTEEASVNFSYASAFGSGSGTASDTLPAGQQRIVPDAISYLRSLGIPIPSQGGQGGTLQLTFTTSTSPPDCTATVRTTTVVSKGRAGLAYAGVPAFRALNDPSYICGLRQNETDRSNLALQNVGSSTDGDITLRLTVLSGFGSTAISRVLPDQVLSPAGFVQINGILGSNGLGLIDGFVRVERVNGTAPYYAYGVINDQSNSDGSFIPPILENDLAGKVLMILPAVVEAGAYTTELVVTNYSSTSKTLHCRYVADAVQLPDHTARFSIDINSSQQLILPDYIQSLRLVGVPGIGEPGQTFAGALLVGVDTGDLSGISVAARTLAPGGGGNFGVFYPSVPEGNSSMHEAWLFGLQQNAENRANLALVNTGEAGEDSDSFSIELYDGVTGQLAAIVGEVTLPARGWRQINRILTQYAPQVTEGYVHVVRTSGRNPFIAYAVINDGAVPGQRTGDGAFIQSSP